MLINISQALAILFSFLSFSLLKLNYNTGNYSLQIQFQTQIAAKESNQRKILHTLRRELL